MLCYMLAKNNSIEYFYKISGYKRKKERNI